MAYILNRIPHLNASIDSREQPNLSEVNINVNCIKCLTEGQQQAVVLVSLKCFKLNYTSRQLLSLGIVKLNLFFLYCCLLPNGSRKKKASKKSPDEIATWRIWRERCERKPITFKRWYKRTSSNSQYTSKLENACTEGRRGLTQA